MPTHDHHDSGWEGVIEALAVTVRPGDIVQGKISALNGVGFVQFERQLDEALVVRVLQEQIIPAVYGAYVSTPRTLGGGRRLAFQATDRTIFAVRLFASPGQVMSVFVWDEANDRQAIGIVRPTARQRRGVKACR